MSNLENDIVDVIGKENLTDLITDYGEVGLDFFLDNELLKAIPIIGTIRGIFRFGSDIKDRILQKKLYDFISPLKNISQKERCRFVEKISQNAKKKREVGLKLIMLIEKLDDFNKPQILSNLFIAMIKEQITADTFFKLSTIVSNVYIGDLKVLKNEEVLLEDIKERLYTNGLLSMIIRKADINNYDSSKLLGKKMAIIEIESETKKVINNLTDSKISLREIKDRIAIEFDFEINTLGESLKEFGLKNSDITTMD